jgi:hypothetical protein
MQRVLILAALAAPLLGCPPQQPPGPPPARVDRPTMPPAPEATPGPVSQPEVPSGAPKTPPADVLPPQAGFPEDAPRSYQIAVERCQEVALLGGADPKPAERRVFTFVLPAGAEVLHVEAAWKDALRKRKLVLGPGACPPCDASVLAKGYGSVLLEQAVQEQQAGGSWFVAMECDPADDDLGVDSPTVTVQACRIAADGGFGGLFPAEGLDQGSQAVLEQGAFGLEGFDGVQTATYGDGKMLAFVAVTASAEEAGARAEAYQTYLASLGGEVVPVEDLRGAAAVHSYGLTTVIFTRGAYVGGVQMAADRDAALALATRLADWLAKG